MAEPARILVVDDVPQNVKLLADLLTHEGYDIVTASNGVEALAQIENTKPDLVLLDVVMPKMTGYEACRQIRANPATAVLPVVMVTTLDAGEERIKSIEAGADDFLNKPVNTAELLARVRSLLRIKHFHDTIEEQKAQLAEWNRTLESRVQEQVSQLDQLGRLKRFFSPQVAELVVSGGEEILKSHRREITAVFFDLRGFTSFSESTEPEEVIAVLEQFRGDLSSRVLAHEGTIEHCAGDGIMVIFNDPVPMPDHVERALRLSIAMRDRVLELTPGWQQREYHLGLGVGVARGYATLGAIGGEGLWHYAAIGSVANLAARLCSEAQAGQILTTPKTLLGLEARIQLEPVGELTLKGFTRPVSAVNIVAFSG